MPTRIAFYDAFALFEGSGRAMLDIIDRLDSDRFEPIVICPRHGDLLGAASARGYQVAVVEPPGRLRLYNKALLSGGSRALPGIGLSLLRYGLRMSGWLRRHRIDLLHCNQTRAALQAGLGGKIARIPVVWVSRIHDDLPPAATRFGAWCARAVVALASTCLEGFQGAETLAEKTVEIPLGVDTDRFAPAGGRPPVPDGLEITTGQPTLVMVGGLHPRKRHDLLLEAAPHILAEVPSARLLIVGGSFDDTGSEYERKLRRRQAELGLNDAVRFTGRRSDVPAILRAATLFVLPSDQEGLPGAVIEAMATGVPVVVTPAAAAPVVHGVTGVVVPRDDAVALSDAVVHLLATPGMARRMGEAARKHVVEHYSLDATVGKYAELYEGLTHDREGERRGPASSIFRAG